MKNKELVKILRSFPEDLEVTLTFTDGEEVTVEFKPDILVSETTLDLDIGDIQDLEIIERDDVYIGPPCE